MATVDPPLPTLSYDYSIRDEDVSSLATVGSPNGYYLIAVSGEASSAANLAVTNITGTSLALSDFVQVLHQTVSNVGATFNNSLTVYQLKGSVAPKNAGAITVTMAGTCADLFIEIVEIENGKEQDTAYQYSVTADDSAGTVVESTLNPNRDPTAKVLGLHTMAVNGSSPTVGSPYTIRSQRVGDSAQFAAADAESSSSVTATWTRGIDQVRAIAASVQIPHMADVYISSWTLADRTNNPYYRTIPSDADPGDMVVAFIAADDGIVSHADFTTRHTSSSRVRIADHLVTESTPVASLFTFTNAGTSKNAVFLMTLKAHDGASPEFDSVAALTGDEEEIQVAQVTAAAGDILVGGFTEGGDADSTANSACICWYNPSAGTVPDTGVIWENSGYPSTPFWELDPPLSRANTGAYRASPSDWPYRSYSAVYTQGAIPAAPETEGQIWSPF